MESDMKKDIRIASQTNTIQKLTALMQSGQKYGFVNFPRSAFLTISSQDSKKNPKSLVDSIVHSFNISDPNYMKAIPSAFINSNDSENQFDLSFINPNEQYYNSTTLENYFNNNEMIFNSFIDFFIRYNPFVAVTFHDKKIISKVMGSPMDTVYVPYNDYFDKIDSICDSLQKYEGKVDTIVLDCPLLSAAVAGKIWDRYNYSVIDFGKVISFARSRFVNKNAQNEKAV